MFDLHASIGFGFGCKLIEIETEETWESSSTWVPFHAYMSVYLGWDGNIMTFHDCIFGGVAIILENPGNLSGVFLSFAFLITRGGFFDSNAKYR